MAKPVEWLEPFQTNPGPAADGSQSAPIIVGLSNGNILVAWQEGDDGTIGGEGDQDIVGKIYDLSGKLVRDAFRINTGRFTDDETDFDVAATNDGGFILTYVDNDDETTTSSAIIWERFDASGNLLFFREIATENVAADVLANPQIAVNLLDNSSYVTFSDDVGTDTDIRAVRLDAEGTIVTAEFDAAQNSNDLDIDGDSAILRNGNLVTVYEEYDAGVPSIEFRINRPDGSSLILAQGSNFTGSDVDPQVASLLNGGFVVVWERAGDIQYQVFDASGNSVSGILNATTGTALENEPDVAALPDGSFVIVWDDDTNGLTMGRRYNPDGSPDGGNFTISDEAGTQQDVGVAADGRILAAWTGEATGEIFGAIWDPRESPVRVGDYGNKSSNFVATENATAAAEGGILNGTSKDNFLFGSSKADIIRGGKGRDTLSGDAGNDTLTGGLQRDILTGGAGRDFFDFNNINETKKGVANRDVITDFKRGVDDIDLRTIDAQKGVGGNQKFKWIGSQKFHKEKGELHFKDAGKHVRVEGDVNGDGKADFHILVNNVGGLNVGDFLL